MAPKEVKEPTIITAMVKLPGGWERRYWSIEYTEDNTLRITSEGIWYLGHWPHLALFVRFLQESFCAGDFETA